ncbi:MAG: MarR family winged helix-turn-helix transcriptional regulator [Thermomicrobiales bacterium]
MIERYTNANLPASGLPAGMTLVRMWAMTAIADGSNRGESIRMTDVAAELGITPRSATAVIDCLEQLGFVRRVADDHDRRSVRVGLTSAAEALLPTVRTAWDEICDHLCGPLNDAERTTMLGLMLKLVNPAM